MLLRPPVLLFAAPQRTSCTAPVANGNINPLKDVPVHPTFPKTSTTTLCTFFEMLLLQSYIPNPDGLVQALATATVLSGPYFASKSGMRFLHGISTEGPTPTSSDGFGVHEFMQGNGNIDANTTPRAMPCDEGSFHFGMSRRWDGSGPARNYHSY